MAEVVRNSRCGICTPVGDPAAMAEAIRQLATNPTLRDTFSANATTAYNADFTLERMDQAYTDLYQSPQTIPTKTT